MLRKDQHERCQRRRGPRSSYDVMSGRNILGLSSSDDLGLLGFEAVTPDAVYIQPDPAGKVAPRLRDSGGYRDARSLSVVQTEEEEVAPAHAQNGGHLRNGYQSANMVASSLFPVAT